MKTKTKKDKRTYLIIALVVILLLLAVGYAAFTDTLTISGNVTGTVNYNVHFDETSVGGTVGKDQKTLTADVTLAYPGDAKEITAVIKNDSSIPVKLTGFKVDAPVDSDNITFDYENLTTDGAETLAAGATCTYKFVVGWKEESEVTSVSGTYKFTFTYEQATTAASVSASHANS